MSILSNNKAPIIEATDEAVKDYSATEPTTKTGKVLRKIAKVIAVVMPFLKYFKFSKNANTN